ncbi:O-antigen ligase family protein [Parabacteroides chongii]|uniref:O-antigen ligase family protein n=1 Tax=Parabacteroides chongii TaxID=2685834 RepID=UPI00240DC12F|nr:O-antigen ligase family protein [Parabacteroides chongii]WFE83641.1 O-antigen ligase family protein [Parabacteroides chongii]
MDNRINTAQIKLSSLILFGGLGSIVFSMLTNNLALFVAIVCIPLLFILFIQSIRYPVILLFVTLIINYYFLGLGRYVKTDGLSFLVDSLLLSLVILIIVHSILFKDISFKTSINVLTIGTFIWSLYCIAEIANPTGMLQAWVLSRTFITNSFVISLIVSTLCVKYKDVKIFTILLSIFTLTAVIKVIMQKFVGFDYAETNWLYNGGGALTHLIGSGTRYFSFFTDAGNFGSNMGFAGIFFAITALYEKKIVYKIYYSLIAIGGFYAMFLSGTRGAIIVPLAAICLYTVISKNIKACISAGSLLIIIYIFFAFTHIGQGNAAIRRMRTAFQPTKDASFIVRKENQKKLATYLKNKPFGEGLGLSGGENKKMSIRFTTSIPVDSWYVKLWVETGIIGAVLYLGVLFITIGRGSWIVMFKIHDPELKGRLTAFLCGIFGMLASAYGNAFWGQYPTAIIAFTCLSLVLNGEYYDKEIKNIEKQ